MFTQRCRDAITVTWTMHHFRHFTSQHYKVSKSEVFGKVIPAANFSISADDVPKIVQIGGCVLKLYPVKLGEFFRHTVEACLLGELVEYAYCKYVQRKLKQVSEKHRRQKMSCF